jgi:uncharacterized protein YjeT (DUF2065 family)
MRDLHWAALALLVWFALEALVLALVPEQVSRVLKDLSPRELRVVGIIQIAIVAALGFFLVKYLLHDS